MGLKTRKRGLKLKGTMNRLISR